jgi:predicted ATPase
MRLDHGPQRQLLQVPELRLNFRVQLNKEVRLLRIEARNYLAYEEAAIEFSKGGLTLVVGPNNSGKSALVSVIDRIAKPHQEGDWTRNGQGESILAAEFELNAEERKYFVGPSAVDASWSDSKVFQRARMTYVHSPRSGRRGLLLQELAIYGGGSFVPIAQLDDKQSLRYRFTKIGPWVQTHDSTDVFDLADVGAYGMPETLLQQEYGRLFEILSRWRENVYHFGSLRPGTSPLREINSTPTLAPSGENLPEVLLWLRTHSDEAWDRINRVVSTLVPDLGTMLVPTDGVNVRLVFRDDRGNERNIKELGTGVEQLLMATYLGVTHARGGMVVIEEPETNLHSQAQRTLSQYLLDWSSDRQFVATSHSSVFLDLAAAAPSRVWLVERRKGISTVTEATSAPVAALDALGVRRSDVLSARAMLLVEGLSDAAIITDWFGAEASKYGARIVEGTGGDAAWHVSDLARWVSAAEALPQPVLFLRDRDEMDPASIRKIEKSGIVFVLPVRELENLLLGVTAVARVVRSRLEASGMDSSAWDESSINRELDAAADAEQSVVILKRVAYRLQPLRPLDRASVDQLAETARGLPGLLTVLRSRRINLSEVRSLWASEEAEVKRIWAQSKFELAAGSDVLARVWKIAGLKYDKEKDGIALARLSKPPTYLRQRLQTFLKALPT